MSSELFFADYSIRFQPRRFKKKKKKQPLNKGGDFRHDLPKAYNASIKKITNKLLLCDNSTSLRITWPKEGSWMRCDAVVTKNNKPR